MFGEQTFAQLRTGFTWQKADKEHHVQHVTRQKANKDLHAQHTRYTAEGTDNPHNALAAGKTCKPSSYTLQKAKILKHDLHQPHHCSDQSGLTAEPPSWGMRVSHLPVQSKLSDHVHVSSSPLCAVKNSVTMCMNHHLFVQSKLPNHVIYLWRQNSTTYMAYILL